MEIKTIIFDLGNVLIGFDHSIAAKKLAKNSPYNEKDVYRLIFDSDLVSKYEKGKIKTVDFYKGMKRLLEFDLGLIQFLKVWNEIFFPKPDVERIVKKLKDRYRLILLSNINAAHYSYIEKNFPIVRIFDRIVLSYRAGVRKPETKIYRLAIRQSRCQPSEIVYIDDRLDLVEAARRLNINSIHFQTLGRFKKELLSYGINSL